MKYGMKWLAAALEMLRQCQSPAPCGSALPSSALTYSTNKQQFYKWNWGSSLPPSLEKKKNLRVRETFHELCQRIFCKQFGIDKTLSAHTSMTPLWRMHQSRSQVVTGKNVFQVQPERGLVRGGSRTGRVLYELCSHSQWVAHWRVERDWFPGSFILLPSSISNPCTKKSRGRPYFPVWSTRKANILLTLLYPFNSALSFFYIPK